jgi:hypothetical protein
MTKLLQQAIAEIEKLPAETQNAIAAHILADLDNGPVRTTADSVLEILAEAKELAQRYRILTGKPLGITGEVAEYEAARILGIELTPARQAGYDATESDGGQIRRLQIKGRCLPEGSKRGQRIGKIDIGKEFDAVLLVLLDANFDATALYEVEREAVVNALTVPGSKARNERGALGVSKFKSIGRARWRR